MRGLTVGGFPRWQGCGSVSSSLSRGQRERPRGNHPTKFQGCHSPCTGHCPPEPPTCRQPPPHPRAVPPATCGVDTPQHAWLRDRVPWCPRPQPRSGSHLAVSYAATFFFFFPPVKKPSYFGPVEKFLFPAGFRGFLFFFFLFSAFLSFRGKMNRFSLLGSRFLLQLGPAAQRGGRGPGMLLPHCWLFGASIKQRGQR